jgi:Domain of unknown function (DUF4384)
MKKLTVLFIAIACCAVSATAQEALTPRDSFWSASDLVDVAPNPAAQAASQVKSASDNKIKKTTQVSGGPPVQRQRAVQVAAKGYGAEPHIVRFKNVSQQPLGLRYALLKAGEGGKLSEVSPETTFHSGDKVKISLMANQTGYIYIIQQGSSGNWRPLFPAQGDLPESNRVEAGHVYQVPSENSGKSFQFNQQTGEERLFILLSRQAVSDLDGVIFTLRQQKKDAAPDPSPAQSQVEASNRISDDLVQKLQSRDLMEVEDPPQETKDPSLGETAIYVVSQGKGDSAASQVFANLVLDHR